MKQALLQSSLRELPEHMIDQWQNSRASRNSRTLPLDIRSTMLFIPIRNALKQFSVQNILYRTISNLIA
jgi:hypothetical protein